MDNPISLKSNTIEENNNQSISLICDELHLLDLQLMAKILKSENEAAEGSGDNISGLVFFDEDITKLFVNPTQNVNNYELDALHKEIKTFEGIIAHRISKSKSRGIFLPLEHIIDAFELTDLEKKIIIMCLAVELDTKYEKIYAYLQNDVAKKKPSFELVLNLLSLDIEERIHKVFDFSNLKIIRFGIIKIAGNNEDESIISRPLKLDSGIIDFITDNSPTGKIINPFENNSEIVYTNPLVSVLLENIHNILSRALICGKRIVINFYGPHGAGKKDAALKLCRKLNKHLMVSNIPINEKDVDLYTISSFCDSISNDCVLSSAVPYFENIDHYSEKNDNADSIKTIIDSLHHSISIIFITGEKPIKYIESYENAVVLPMKFKMPEEHERKNIWVSESRNYTIDEFVDFENLAEKFRFTQGQIKNALEIAFNNSLLRSEGSGMVRTDDIYIACGLLSKSKLDNQAVKVDIRHTWEDIILPEYQMEQLKEICNQVKYRHVVYGDWGFGRKLPYGKGLHVVFSGSSGTGKTMAAQIIANELELDLYKIDLSQVVSKYIGETEKNLHQIFKEAETSNAIVFFDEADALFGKRCEIKDAHDRHANIETSYLLQKMEEFSGITILTTNFKDNMDQAFLRRVHFSIDFPYPDMEMRKNIWKVTFPKEAPLDNELDFETIASKIDLAGGNIKNIAVNAAFLAAEDESTIKLNHIWKAAYSEYVKLGRIWKEN